MIYVNIIYIYIHIYIYIRVCVGGAYVLPDFQQLRLYSIRNLRSFSKTFWLKIFRRLHIYIYIYIYMCVCVCVCVFYELQLSIKTNNQ